MVAQEFLNLAGQFQLSTYVGLEDFADKLNFMFSVVFLILSMMIVTIKSYFFKPLACYISTTPSGSNFEAYMENYCWVHGTIPVLSNEILPQNQPEWSAWDKSRRINYYQWVPFILGLQCIMFYIPKIIWQIICFNKTGTNLESFVKMANDASHLPPEERKNTLERICRTIEDMLYKHRDYRQGKIANLRRTIYDCCNFCVFSKHLGTWLVLSYFAIKGLYFLNVVGQLYILKSFLGFHNTSLSFGYTILSNMINGQEWHKTGIFPRVSYCYNSEIKVIGASNAYIAQCALPINMLNEKIYIFISLWIFFVCIVTLISIGIWVSRMMFLKRRADFIKEFLIMRDKYDGKEKVLINQFITEFLRYDGIFLIYMFVLNVGDLVTSEIVNILYDIYKNKYKDLDFRNFNNYKKLTDQFPGKDDSNDQYV